MWRYGCPKIPDSDSDVGDWTGSEGTSSYEEYETNVIGQNWSGEMVSVLLEDWELARAALSCHLLQDLLCQEMQEPTVTVYGSLSYLGRAVAWRGVWVENRQRQVAEFRQKIGKEELK